MELHLPLDNIAGVFQIFVVFTMVLESGPGPVPGCSLL